MVGERTAPSPASSSDSWLAAIGGSLLALAGHAELLRRFGTVLPYRDPWKATAVDLLGPWTQGRLHLGNFFQPLNDHWPVLTRALSFLLVRINGQWNNLVETCANALLLTAALTLFLRLILPSLASWSRVPFALLTGLLFALPITWENTLWGIQSLVYLHVGFTLTYLGAVCFTRTFSKLWWLGQLTGILVLFTVHSGILAQAAAILILSLRILRSDGERRANFASLGIAVGTLALFALFFPALKSTAAFRADSWELALDVFLRQLAWPFPHPAWAFVVYLPWILFAYDRIFHRRPSSGDAFLLAVGLWVGAQAAAIGYGRGAETYTFVSRYCDYLALGWLVNAACLIRFLPQLPSRRIRIAFLLLIAAWLAAPVSSFHSESIGSHAGYNLSRREGENARNLERLQRYFATRDPQVFGAEGQREFYTYPPEILPLLDRPAFAALLPPESGAPGARADHGRIGKFADVLIAHPMTIGLIGGLFLAGSAFGRGRRNIESRASEPLIYEPDSRSQLIARFLPLAGLLGLVGALLGWEHPSIFSHEERSVAAFQPAFPGAISEALIFDRFDGARSLSVEARGGVVSEPLSLRKFWFGTRLASEPEFRGTLRSRPFRLQSDYLLVPFTGFPCSPGNGLRLRVVDPENEHETWISYEAPNPGVGFDIWTINVSAYRGQNASVVLFDGRDGVDGGWTGAASPLQATDASLAHKWRISLHRLRSNPTHDTLLWVALTLAAVCGAQTFRARHPLGT